MNDQTPRRPKQQLDDIEQQIGQVVHSRAAPVKQSLDDVSRVTADAVMMQFEASAEQVEKLSEATKAQIDKLVGELERQMEETVAVLHERGRVARKIVEDIGALTRGFRDTCVEFQRKMGG